jgi:hypothetical protein
LAGFKEIAAVSEGKAPGILLSDEKTNFYQHLPFFVFAIR